MADNASLGAAKTAKNDESKHDDHGKLFMLTHDADGTGNIDMDDVEFMGYLEGDGDFRSKEVTALRDEADIIITNPPFSMFHEFIRWVLEGKKQFSVIGNQNAIKYKEVFPQLKTNKMWLGQGFKSNVGYFRTPQYEDYATAGEHKEGFIRVSGVMWFTNIDLGKRHEPLLLMTKAHNLKFNSRLQKKLQKDFGRVEYPLYANYRALEVPYTECIPSDYDGIMGVPITFMDRYNPDQFELLGMSGDLAWAKSECDFFTPPSDEVQRECKAKSKTWRVQKVYVNDDEGLPLVPIYDRLFIRPKKKGAEA